jgi:hypothetical protein
LMPLQMRTTLDAQDGLKQEFHKSLVMSFNWSISLMSSQLTDTSTDGQSRSLPIKARLVRVGNGGAHSRQVRLWTLMTSLCGTRAPSWKLKSSRYLLLG